MVRASRHSLPNPRAGDCRCCKPIPSPTTPVIRGCHRTRDSAWLYGCNSDLGVASRSSSPGKSGSLGLEAVIDQENERETVDVAQRQQSLAVHMAVRMSQRRTKKRTVAASVSTRPSPGEGASAIGELPVSSEGAQGFLARVVRFICHPGGGRGPGCRFLWIPTAPGCLQVCWRAYQPGHSSSGFSPFHQASAAGHQAIPATLPALFCAGCGPCS